MARARVIVVLLVALGNIQIGWSFPLRKSAFARQPLLLLAQSDKNRPPNPFQGISDMLSNMDDVIDDFMSKRMGNGEVFYGKRKANPSNRPNTAGRYNGMGMSDKLKIDVTREAREKALERKREKEQKQRD